MKARKRIAQVSAKQLAKESDAWREIARRIAEGSVTNMYGGTTDLRDEGVISERCCWMMRTAVEDHIALDNVAWPNGNVRQNQECRVLAALLLALESEDDGR